MWLSYEMAMRGLMIGLYQSTVPTGTTNVTRSSGWLCRSDQAEVETRLKNCDKLSCKGNQKPKAETLRTGQ
jgi:hypothetical protein